MSCMFRECKALTALDVSGFKIDCVEDVSSIDSCFVDIKSTVAKF